MSIENLILAGIVLFLMFILYKTLGNQQKKNPQLPDKLRFFSEKTGQIVEMRLVESNAEHETNEKAKDEAFLLSARIAFQQISESFSGGNLTVLKENVEPKVYNAFEKEIKSREEKKQKVDFSLICFDSAEIKHKSPERDVITVQFVTEQINVLKNEKGEPIEGDPMTISTVKDLWTFTKQSKNKWLLSAAQSEVVYE